MVDRSGGLSLVASPAAGASIGESVTENEELPLPSRRKENVRRSDGYRLIRYERLPVGRECGVRQRSRVVFRLMNGNHNVQYSWRVVVIGKSWLRCDA